MASAGFVWIQTAEIRQLYIYAPGIGRTRWRAATAAPCGVHLPVRARARATEQRSTSRRPGQLARDLDFHVSFGLSTLETEGVGARMRDDVRHTGGVGIGYSLQMLCSSGKQPIDISENKKIYTNRISSYFLLVYSHEIQNKFASNYFLLNMST